MNCTIDYQRIEQCTVVSIVPWIVHWIATSSVRSNASAVTGSFVQSNVDSVANSIVESSLKVLVDSVVTYIAKSNTHIRFMIRLQNEL